MYGREEMCIQGCCVGPEEGEYLENVGVDVKIIFKRIFKKCHEKGLTELIWLKIQTRGGRL
jgi:hypothetical protein